ncbi:hypothetical protein [Virgibacillus salexigens]|nr:hypothetical protein [Virgibacillus massiliensis]
MVDAFMYMYVVGAGTAAGVASIAFVSWKIVQRSNSKQTKRKKKTGVR